MKKFFIILCAAICALSISAHVVKVYKDGEIKYELTDADSVVFAEKSEAKPQKITITASIKLPTNDPSAPKTQIKPNAEDLVNPTEGSTIHFHWEAGDQVIITNGTKSSLFTIDDNSISGNTASFTGTALDDMSSYNVFYAGKNISEELVAHLMESDPIELTNAAGNYNIIVVSEDGNESGFTMNEFFNTLRLKLTGKDITLGAVKYYCAGADIDNPSTTINFGTDGLALSATAQEVWLPINATNSGLTFRFFDTTGNLIMEKSTSMSWTGFEDYNELVTFPELEIKEALPKYICFEALEAGSTIDLDGYGRPSGFEYSTDGENWVDFNAVITLANVGDKCYFKTKSPRYNIYHELFPGFSTTCNFKGSGNLKVSGNIMALLDSENPPTTMTDDYANCFKQLFQYNENVSDASELVLPATTLAENCYYSMFSGCTKLEKAPSILATTLAKSCCNSMFYNCAKLTTAPPALLAADLAESCYYSMFDRCSTLVTPPVMAAKILGDHSCQGMFSDCQLLTSAPDLSSITTVGANSCDAMFARCLSLTTAPVLNATTLGDNCYNQMFMGCTGLTAAPALPATTLVYGCYASMFDGCTNLTTAPVLSAQTLVPYCYSAMFASCSKLSSVTMLATDGFDSTWCLNSWVNNAGPGTVYVSKNISDANKTIVTDKSSGWTVTKLTE